MAKCSSCARTTTFGNWKPKSQKRTARPIKPNLQKVNKQIICTSCLRSNKSKALKLAAA